MAQAFNLTAQLNLRGPNNIKQVVSDIKRQIGTINGNIKLTIDASAVNNTSKLSKSLQQLNTNLANVASSASAASAAIKNFSQSVSSVGNGASKLSSNINKTVQSVNNLGSTSTKVAKNVATARTEMEEFGRQSALAIRRFAAFSAVTGVFFSLSRSINTGLKSFIDFDKELVKLQQITGKSAEGLKDLQNEIVRLSTGLGVSSDSLIQVSSTLAQAGLSATETRSALEALARSSLAPSFDDINQTVEGSIALMRQFGISAKDLEKALGSVNSVAAAFAVEASDIIAAIQRTGGVFASASKGVSEGKDALNEFIAVFTSVRATTRESAETIATGLRTIFTRIQRAGTIEALKEFGVNLTDVEGKFVGAYKAVQLLSEGLGRIDPRDIKFSQIVEELGGFRQIGKVIPLIQQFATAQEALRVAQAGQGSLATDAAKAQLSLANQISKVREEFLSLIREIGSGDTFQTLAKGALSLASGLIKITGGLKGVLPALTILASGAALRGVTQFAGGFVGGLRKVQGKPGSPNESTASSIGRNVASTLVGAKTEQVSRDLDQNSAALDKVSSKLDDVSSSLNTLNNTINSINSILNNNNTLLQQSIASLTSNTSSLDRLTDAINNFNPGGGGTLRDGGRVLGFARGGTVPGSGRGDKVPAMLEPGEVVMSNKAVNRYGRGNLVRMNKYASGGPIYIESSLGNLYNQNIAGSKRIKFGKTIQNQDEVGVTIKGIPVELKSSDFPSLIEFISQTYQKNISQYKKYAKQEQVSYDGQTPTALFSQKSLDVDKLDLPLPPPPAQWAKGNAFEQFLQQKYPKLKSSTRINTNSSFEDIVKDHFSPLDFESGDAKFEKSATDYFTKNKFGQDREKNLKILSKRLRDQQDALSWTTAQDKFTQQNSKPLKSVNVYYPDNPEKTKSDFDRYYQTKYNEEIIKNAGNTSISTTDITKARGLSIGGQIQRFVVGGAVTKEDADKASRKEVLEVLSSRPGGIDTTAKKVGVSAAEIYEILGKRSPDARTKALQEAIRHEYMVTANRKAGAVKGQITKLTNQNLVVAAAGMFGKKFSDTTETIDSPLLSSSPKVRIISGIMNSNISSSMASMLSQGTNDLTSKVTESAMISDILQRLGLGKELNLDFDRTLADGADKILSDPGAPIFAEFSNRDKVADALKGATLTNLGKSLVDVVKEKKELLSYMRVVTARPQSTLDLVQQWLADKDLPIPLSQFKGFGQTGVSAKDIAQLKAAFLSPDSLFVDDDARNIQAADLRKNEGILTYQYRTGSSLANSQAEGDMQGLLLEQIVQKLGGPGALKGFGFDFPNGLGAAAKYFDLPDDIPTDVKRTISGPSTITDNIVTYLKNVMGYKLGGKVYDLQKGTGLSNQEFDELVKYGNTNDFSDSEFKDYLASYLQKKNAKKDLRSNNEQLRRVLLSGTSKQSPSQKQSDLARQLMGEPDPQYNPKYDKARTLAVGGLAEAAPEMESLMMGLYGNRNRQKKPSKNYGKIGLRSDGSAITATYFKNDQREGFVSAYKMRDYLYYVGLSKATKGYGPRLYDAVMEEATSKGAMLTADRSLVSGAAKNVWEYYFKNRGDVKKTPLKPDDWTRNQSMVDPKLYGKPETWPPATDPAWILQSGYSKSPSLINDPNSVVRMDKAQNSGSMAAQYFSRSMGGRLPSFASGGSVPALVSNGEAYVPPETAQKIGYGTLNRMNQADKNGMGRFANGGISVFKGPGSGTSDSIRTNLPVGSFVIREKATKALGLNRGGAIGAQRFAFGGTPDDTDLVRSRARNKGVSFDAEVEMMRKALLDAAKDLMNPSERQNTLRIMALENKTRLELINKKREADLKAITEEARIERNRIKSQERTAIGAAGGDKTKIKSIRQEADLKRKELVQSTAQKKLEVDSDTKGQKDSISNSLIEQIRSIDPSLAADALRDLSAEITKGFDAGKSLNDIIVSSRGLKEVFNGQMDAAKAQSIVVEQLTTQFGLTKDAVESLASASDVQLSDAFDKNSAAAARMSAMLAKASLVVGTFSSAAANAIRSFGGSENRGAVTTAAGVEGFGSTVSTLIAALSQVKPAVESVIGIMAKMGGSLGGLATTMGPALMGLLTNPITAVVAGVAVAAVGLAAAFKESWNAAREFDKQLANKRVEQSLERIGVMFEDFSKDMSKIDILSDINKELNQAIGNAFTAINIDTQVPKMFWANMIDAATGGADAAQRSTILEQKGFGAYLESTSLFGSGRKGQERNMFELAPQLASQQAQTFKPMADNIFKLFDSKLRTGSSIDELMGELRDATGAPTQFANAIARSNPIIEEQIIKTQARADLTDKEKQSMINGIVAREAEKQAVLNTRASLRQIEFEKLDKAVGKFVTSLERVYSNMEMSINKASFEVQKLSDSAELASASLSGNAKAGETRLSAINILQNRRAYSTQDQNNAVDMASSFFGSLSPAMSSILNIGDKLETSILSTINRTRQSEPGATDERIFAKIESNLNRVLGDLQIPENLVPKFSEQIKNALKDIKTKGDLDTVNFEQIAEEVPGLTKQIESARRAQEVAVKALEFYQSQLNEYANAMNTMVELQFEANKDFGRAIDIIKNGNNELSKVFGREISLRDQVNTILSRTSRQTGGATDPTDISRNILNLENSRKILQGASNSAADRGPGAKGEFVVMQDRLRKNNLALRENYDALKNLAESSDIASAAMEKIQEIQKRREAGANLIEKVVTSNPEELVKLNSAIGRLQNNMMGIVNNGTTSEQRGESLQAFNQIAPLLGDGAKQNALKANVLESMLIESGQGVNPMFAQILDSLRNPEADPEMQTAIATYKEGLRIQSEANMRLGEIKQLMRDNTADIAAEKLKTAITGAKLSFESQTLNEINKNIIDLKELVKNRGPAAAGLAMGGIVYASAGQAIDFAPKGTDTVPAMLTPGEFVVNRRATQANLPLLQNINSGKYSNGGKVNYLSDGGIIPGFGWSDQKAQRDLKKDPKESDLVTQTLFTEIKKDPSSALLNKYILAPAVSYRQGPSLRQTFSDPANTPINELLPTGTASGAGYYPNTIIARRERGGFDDVIIKGFASDVKDKFLRESISDIPVLDNSSSILGDGKKSIALTDLNKYKEYYQKLIDLLNSPAGLQNIKNKILDKPFTDIGSLKITDNDDNIIIDNLSKISDKYMYLLDQGNTVSLSRQGATIKDGLWPWFGGGILGIPTGGGYLRGWEQNQKDNYTGINNSGMTMELSPKPIPNNIDLIETIKQDLENLNKIDPRDKRYFKESSESISRKDNINTLRAFYDKQLFSIQLDQSVLNGKKAKGKILPLTLYNISSADWEQQIANYQDKLNNIAPDVLTNLLSQKSEQFIRLDDTINKKSLSFPWISSQFDSEVEKFGLSSNDLIKNSKGLFAKDNYFSEVEDLTFGKEGDDLFFPYKKISKGTSYNDSTRAFEKQLEEYMVVAEGGDPKSSIFSSLSSIGNKALYIPANNWDLFTQRLQRQVEAAKKSFDPATIFYWKDGFNPVLNIPSNFMQDALLSDAVNKKVVLPSLDNNLLLKPVDITNPKYIEYLKKKTEEEKTAAGVDAAKKGAKITLEKEEALTSAKKVGIARAVYDIGKNVVGLKSAKPADMSSIRPIIDELAQKATPLSSQNGQPVPDNRINNPAWLINDAYRAFFDELLYSQADTGTFLKGLGIELHDDNFDFKGSVPVPGFKGKTEFAYADYKNPGMVERAIRNIINREMMMKSMGGFAGSLSDENKQKATIKANTARIKGQGNKEDVVPESYKDMAEIGLDPRNVFESQNFRTDNYLNALEELYKTGANQSGDLVFNPGDPNVLTASKSIDTLKTWYNTQQDRLVNTGLPKAQMITHQESLAPGSDTFKNIEKTYPASQEANAFLTGNKFGPLPDQQQLINMLSLEIGEPINPINKAMGGLIYASAGQLVNFQPRGTDTVPAMLTPGEFVVNRSATRDNLPLLKAINNGYSAGGIVYLAEGGLSPGKDPSRFGPDGRLLSVDERVEMRMKEAREREAAAAAQIDQESDARIQASIDQSRARAAERAEAARAKTEQAKPHKEAMRAKAQAAGMDNSTFEYKYAESKKYGTDVAHQIPMSPQEKQEQFDRHLAGVKKDYAGWNADFERRHTAAQQSVNNIMKPYREEQDSIDKKYGYDQAFAKRFLEKTRRKPEPGGTSPAYRYAVSNSYSRRKQIEKKLYEEFSGSSPEAKSIIDSALNSVFAFATTTQRLNNEELERRVREEITKRMRERRLSPATKREIMTPNWTERFAGADNRGDIRMGSGPSGVGNILSSAFNNMFRPAYAARQRRNYRRNPGSSFAGNGRNIVDNSPNTKSRGLSPFEQRLAEIVDLPGMERVMGSLDKKIRRKSSGGLIYANNGMLVPYSPKGTDIIPAMLTPGEFVINRESTQKYRPVLEAINNGNYNRGGIVNYLQNGGYLPIYRGDGGGANGAGQKFDITSYMGDIVSKIGSGITEAIDKAIKNVKSPNTNNAGVSSNSQDMTSIDNFVTRLNNIANILSNIYIPPQITITGKHDVVVTINGDTVLNQLQPDIQGIVMSAINQAFKNLKANNPENNTIDFNIDFNQKIGSIS